MKHLVAFDGSEGAESALTYATDIAGGIFVPLEFELARNSV